MKINKIASVQIAVVLVLLLLLVLLLYTFFHESGHALVGILFGGKITSFSVNFFNLSAHVGIDGHFDPLQNSLISVAGVTLPLLLCMGMLLLTPKKGEAILEWFKVIAVMATVNSLLAWIVIPILVLGGQTAGDDSVNFLRYSQLPPLLVSGTMLLVYLGCAALFLRRMDGFRGLKERFQSATFSLSFPENRRSFATLSAVGLVGVAATLGLTLAFPERPLEPPAGYQLVSDLDLRQKAYQDEVVYQFTLHKPGKVSLFFALMNIKGAPTILKLTGPDGYDSTFMAASDPKFSSGRASVHPQEIELRGGDYQVRVTLQQTRGEVRVYSRLEQ